MRTKLGVLAIGCLCLPFFQCGGGDDATGAQVTDAGSGDATTTDGAPPINDSGPVDSGPPIVTVNGTLMGRASDGGPLASRAVVVIDANDVVTKVTTDASGKFTVAGVQTPYDVAIAFDPPDAATLGLARYYAGISAPNPIVTGDDYAPYTSPPLQQSTVTFTVNACNSCYIYFGSPDYNARESGTGAASPYSVPYTWRGSATHSAAMHIYVADHTNVYQSYVDLPAQALNAGGTTALGTPTLAAVSNGNISATVDLPTSYQLDNVVMTISHADGSILGSSGALSTSPAVGNYPRLPNMVLMAATSLYLGNATSGGTVVYTEPTIPGSVTMSPPAAPTSLTPANAATGVTDAMNLTWSASGSSTYLVDLTTTAGANTYVYTDQPSIVLARLTKGGMGLSPATGFTWEVVAGGNYASVDDVVTQTAAANAAVFYEGDSVTQTFTTQ